MNRPIYETQNDRTAERKVAELVAAKRGLTAYAMPLRYAVDFAFCRGRVIEWWVEVKCRTNPREKYPTYLLSLGKWAGMMGLFGQTGIPAMLVVGWTDCIGVLELPAPRMAVEIGGRTDRNDRQDVEPCVLIPVSQFAIYGNVADSLTGLAESV